MGEVYLAEDTNLKRQVAIKVLPQKFALDKERLARLEREARLLASLNHPNIATIHGLERSERQQFLVMELVEGDTLAERIRKGPLPVDETLEVCRQIAEGLESAHEKGIIHRDLKPSNVKVTPERMVKILDFGLAKAFLGEAADSGLSKSPAITEEMTGRGVILGTAAYMSPEQAKGKAVDKRADIWAFGCILFECLTGKRVFRGDTISETLASILKDEPQWKDLPITTLLKITELIKRCLVKDPRNRLHDIADARIALAEIQREPETAIISTDRMKAPALRFSWVWLLASLIVGAAVTAIVFFGLLPSRTQDIGDYQKQSHFTFELDEEEQIAVDMDQLLFDISANGETIAWIGPPEPERKIFYRSLDSLEIKAVSGTEGAENLYIKLTFDGSEVSFVRDGVLWRRTLEGGVSQKIFDGGAEGSIWSWDWGKDGSFVIGPAYSGLIRLSRPGAAPETLTTLNAEVNEVVHQFPLILPNKKAALFSVGAGYMYNTHIETLNFESPEAIRRPLLENAYFVNYVPTGYLLFGREGTIYVAPFDLKNLRLTGPEVPVLSNIQSDHWGMADQFAVSQNGTLVYIPEQGLMDYQLAWIDLQGGLELLPFPSQPYGSLRISPLADQVSVCSRKLGQRGRNLYILDLRRNIAKELVTAGTDDYNGSWGSDGSRLIVNSNQDGPIAPFLIDFADTTVEKKLMTSEYDCHVTSWSRDGKQLIYTERLPYGKMRIGSISLGDPENKIALLTSGDANEKSGILSPDGLWMAYISYQQEQPEVYIRNMDGSIKEKVSSDGGEEPAWSLDGKKLFYMNKEGTKLLSVEVKRGEELDLGKETVVIEKPVGFDFYKIGWQFGRPSYDVHPDGQKFLFIVKKKSEQKMKVGVILNFFEELKRKVPIGK
ncbi:MAG: serine/threonine-protein kinase [Candidatus Aminicenantes bacterium]|nr:serine/threonine-protein kinase [Candidatus Aminicenantes bacterium]